MDQPGSLHSSLPSPPARLFLPRPFSCRACLYGGRLGGGGGCKGGCSPEPEALLAPGEEAEGQEEAEGLPLPASAPAPRSPSPPTPPPSPPAAPSLRGREPSLPSVPPSPSLRRRAKSLPLPGERGLRPAVQPRQQQSPSRRKTVRFADCLGLELTAVRHFCQSEQQEPREPRPPSLAAQQLLKTRKPPALGELEPFPAPFPAPLLPPLEPLFPPSPGSGAGFLQRLRAQKVALEWVRAEARGLRGAVRVLNLAFQKEVSVRYSLDRWATALELPASYQPGAGLGPETDRFAFQLPLPAAGAPPMALEFALRYRVQGAEFWDNNRGDNYRLRASTRASAGEGAGPAAPHADAWIHFI